ncbi:hypothetical protein [Streptomyces sp. bgisy126]|uniref:hypothetical protein n=1 Tax=unclassified Streptomyces TaxID=2593676 RepID=UPI003EBB1A66
MKIEVPARTLTFTAGSGSTPPAHRRFRARSTARVTPATVTASRTGRSRFPVVWSRAREARKAQSTAWTPIHRSSPTAASVGSGLSTSRLNGVPPSTNSSIGTKRWKVHRVYNSTFSALLRRDHHPVSLDIRPPPPEI